MPASPGTPRKRPSGSGRANFSASRTSTMNHSGFSGVDRGSKWRSRGSQAVWSG